MEAIEALNIGEFLGLVFAVVSLIISMVAVIVVTARRGGGLSEFDRALAEEIRAARADKEAITTMEKVVSGLLASNAGLAEELRQSGQMLLKAAQWMPGQADNEAAALYNDIVDGVPANAKAGGTHPDAAEGKEAF